MSLDDLLKGLAVFQDGMKQYAVTSAINDAHEQLTALNQQQLDRQQSLQAHSQLQQQLAMRLSAAGADAAHIQAATENLAPTQGAQFAMQGQMDMQKNSQDFQSGQNAAERKLKWDIANLQMGKQGQKLSKQEVDFISTHQKAFDTQAKKPIEALNQLQLAKDALKSDNPIADKSIVNFLARASGEVGALTEADKKPFGGSTAYEAQAAQFLKNAKDGKFTPENRKFVSQLINVYEGAQRKNVMSIRDRLAERAAKQADIGGYKLDKPTIAEMLYASPAQQMDQKAQEQAAKQDKIKRLQAWLASPEAKANPSKAQAAQSALSQLQGQ